MACFSFLLASAVISPVNANDGYIAGKNEEIYGTWINPDYDRINMSARIINKPDGTVESYSTLFLPVPICTGARTIINKWTDSVGNIWYKSIEKSIGCGAYYELHRISNSGKTWEHAYSSIDYPAEIDPDDVTANYRIYYR